MSFKLPLGMEGALWFIGHMNILIWAMPLGNWLLIDMCYAFRKCMGTVRLCGRALIGGFLVGASSPPFVWIIRVSLTLPLVGLLLLFALS